jgi:hypothetical protein
LLVAVVDAEGTPIRGFAARDCRRITTDALRHRVAWEAADLGRLKGKTVRLRFYLSGGARLYAFQVRAPGPRAG